MHKVRMKTQVLSVIIGIVFFSILFLGISLNLILQHQFKEYIIKQQVEKEKEITSNLSQLYKEDTKEWNVDSVHAIGMYAMYEGYFITLKDTDNQIIWDATTHDMALCNQIMENIQQRMKKESPNLNGTFKSITTKLSMNNQEIGQVTIKYYGPYFYSSNDFIYLKELNVILIIVSVLSLIFATISSIVLANKLIRPVKKMNELAEKMSKGDYKQQIEIQSMNLEFSELAEVMNQLSLALDEQETIKMMLTADVAHELRTPLTSVSTHLEAMIEGIWKPDQARLETCYNEIERLKNLIEDLETLAKSDAKNRSIKIETVDISQIIKCQLELMKKDILQKNIAIHYQPTEIYLNCDGDRMNQVICNLLSNAIKYIDKPNGNIWVDTQISHNKIGIQIRDDGMGIEERDLKYIFERFYRADKSRNRKTGGAGIGLSIVKSIIIAHKGSIEVESKLGEGTTFTIYLPQNTR